MVFKMNTALKLLWNTDSQTLTTIFNWTIKNFKEETVQSDVCQLQKTCVNNREPSIKEKPDGLD